MADRLPECDRKAAPSWVQMVKARRRRRRNHASLSASAASRELEERSVVRHSLWWGTVCRPSCHPLDFVPRVENGQFFSRARTSRHGWTRILFARLLYIQGTAISIVLRVSLLELFQKDGRRWLEAGLLQCRNAVRRKA